MEIIINVRDDAEKYTVIDLLKRINLKKLSTSTIDKEVYEFPAGEPLIYSFNPEGRPPKLNEAEISDLCEDRRNGLKIKDIADKYKVSVRLVKKILEVHGLTNKRLNK